MNNLHVNDLSTPPRWHKQPVSYVASKYRLLDALMPHIPYRRAYLEACVGCSPVFLNRKRSKLEVLNDKYTGISNYYRVIQSNTGYQRLREMVNESIHSEEIFEHNKLKLIALDKMPYANSLREIEERDILYAYYWYYNLATSVFGRAEVFYQTNKENMASDLRQLWTGVDRIVNLHERLKFVNIWHGSVIECLHYWDRQDMVIYIDPPYYDTTDCFRVNFTERDHYDLLETVKDCQAYIVISNYDNSLYSSYDFKKIHLEHDRQSMGNNSNRAETIYIHEGIVV